MTPQTAKPTEQQQEKPLRSLNELHNISKNITDGTIIAQLREHQKQSFIQLFLSLGLFICICIVAFNQPQQNNPQAQETKKEQVEKTKPVLTQLKKAE